MSAAKRILVAAGVALDFIAPKLADRLATWLWTHAINQALAAQRAETAPHPADTPVPAATPDAPHSTPTPDTSTWTERDADSSRQNP